MDFSLKKMNVLIINASPRKNGNIDRMLKAMQDEAERLGHEVSNVRVDQLHVAPCRGCMACRSKLRCVLPEDDAQRVLEQIRWCEVLVIGAPCYWGNIPGSLKLLFDRIVYGMMGENRLGIPVPLHKGKKAVVVTTCTTIWPFNIIANQTRGVKRALKEILRYSGFRLVKTIQKGGTKNGKPVGDRELQRCKKAMRAVF